MKKLMILAWMILFFAPFAWAQEKCEAPVWNVGDKWTYKDVTGATWTNEVQDIKDNLYIVKKGGRRDLPFSGGTKDLYAFDRKTLKVKYLIEESGRRVKYTELFRDMFNFPIFVGKKWTELTYGNTDNMASYTDITKYNHFEVKGIEEVTTTVGTFKTYWIDCHQEGIHAGQFSNPTHAGYSRVQIWFSPEVKTWIKRKSEAASQPSLVFEIEDAELISYEIEPMVMREPTESTQARMRVRASQ
jgi:hypothetical protein